MKELNLLRFYHTNVLKMLRNLQQYVLKMLHFNKKMY